MHIHRSPRKRTGLSLTLPFSLGEYPRSLTHFTAMKLKNGGRGWGCSNALEQFLTLILIIEKLDQWYAVVYNKYLPVALPLSLGFLDEPIPKGILNLFFKSFQNSTKYSSRVQSCISPQGKNKYHIIHCGLPLIKFKFTIEEEGGGGEKKYNRMSSTSFN